MSPHRDFHYWPPNRDGRLMGGLLIGARLYYAAKSRESKDWVRVRENPRSQCAVRAASQKKSISKGCQLRKLPGYYEAGSSKIQTIIHRKVKFCCLFSQKRQVLFAGERWKTVPLRFCGEVVLLQNFPSEVHVSCHTTILQLIHI